MAQNGNKVAGGNVPLVTVGMMNAINGIKRMNGAEITQNTHLGSLYDDIAGRLGKLSVGEPIPQNILNDSKQLFQAIGQEPYETYKSNLQALSTRTGHNIAPISGPPNINHSSVSPQVQSLLSSPSVKPGIHKLSDGSTFIKGTDGSITPQ